MKNFFTLGLVALLLSALSFSASAAPSSPFGFYEDAESARVAFSAARRAAAFEHMADEAKAQRRRAIETAYHKAENDPAALARLAAQYKLVMFRPRPDDGVGIMSDSTCLKTINAPLKVWDSITGETSFSGTFEWKDPQCPIQDANYTTGPVGGQDGAGLVFTNIPSTSYSKIRSWNLTTWDWNGTQRDYTTNPSWTPGSGSNAYAVIFAAQDSLLGTSSTTGFYEWLKGTSWVYFNSSFTDSGSVQMTYAHDWNTTNLSSAQFGASGSNDVSLSGSVTYSFNNSNKFAVGGLWTSY